MKPNKSIGKNAILNVLRQGLSIVFPLITYPYAVRILGAEGIGKVNYAQSIISYFALLAALGTSNYIIREASRKKNDRHKMEMLINEVYSINIVFTVCAYLLILIAVFFVPKFSMYKEIMLLVSLNILFTTLGVDWINVIYEDFWRITVRSIFTYLISFVLLFALVRDSEDYMAYALLSVATTGIICISNRVHFRKIIPIKFTMNMKIRKHIGPLFSLFFNSIAVTINTNFDTTMLGWIHGDFYVGLYSFSVKIFTVVKSLISAVFLVAVPRLSMFAEADATEQYRELITRISRYVLMLVVPLSIGLFITAERVTVLLGGAEMLQAKNSLQILSLTLILSALTGILMNAVNISLRRERNTLVAMAIGALVNICLNCLCIPTMYHNGAALTTFMAEAVVMVLLVVMFKDIRKYVKLREIRDTIIKSFGAAIVMGAGCVCCLTTIRNNILSLVISICGGCLIYIVLLFLFKEELCYSLVKKVKQKINK